jgi:hypothetical protein
MRENGNKAPPALPGWKSVRQLEDEGVAGGCHFIRIQLEKLKEELTERLKSEGLREDDAVARVESEFVGIKSSHAGSSGGGRGLYASPEALAMLNLKHILPHAPRAWRSASQLIIRREVKGVVSIVDKKLKTLRAVLIREAVEAGSSENEATAMVDQELVGYRNTGYGSQEALYASPKALQMLQDDGVLVPRGRGPNHCR